MSLNRQHRLNGIHDPVTGRIRGYRNPITNNDDDMFAADTIAVGVSRALVPSDNGQTLEMTAAGLTLTANPGALPLGFNCTVIPNGTTSIAAGAGVLLNGAGATLTRAVASNPLFNIVARVSAAGSYVVSGV